MIDLYCERTAPGLLGEPLNALTNLAFLAAAWLCWRHAGAHGRRYPSVVLMIVLAAAIGIGSALFHTFATAWAQWCDVIPILLFQLFFIACYFRQVQHYGDGRLALIFVLFFALGYLCGHYPHLFNGSLLYAPALLVLLFAGIVHLRSGKPGRYRLLLAAGVFLLSLSFRSIDMVLCQWFETGSHFLWHLCNGLLIYLVVRAYMDSLAPRMAAQTRP